MTIIQLFEKKDDVPRVDTVKVKVSFGGPTLSLIQADYWIRPRHIPGYRALIYLINVTQGWLLENIGVYGMVGRVLSVEHLRGWYSGGFDSVLVEVVLGSEFYYWGEEEKVCKVVCPPALRLIQGRKK